MNARVIDSCPLRKQSNKFLSLLGMRLDLLRIARIGAYLAHLQLNVKSNASAFTETADEFICTHGHAARILRVHGGESCYVSVESG